MTTIAQGASATITVTNGANVTLSSERDSVARLTVATGIEPGKIVTSSHAGRKMYGPFPAGTLTLNAVYGYCSYYVSTDGTNDIGETPQFVTLDTTDISTLNDAGKPIAKGVLLKDPVTRLFYGQSDGAGSYSNFGGAGSVALDDIWDAAGDIVVGTGPDTAEVLPVGTAGQILAVNADADGLEWVNEPAEIRAYYFSAAGTYLVQLGAGVAYDIFLTSFPNGASVTVYDNTIAGSPTLLATTTNGTGGTLTNYSIPIGTPPTYAQASTAILLVTTGVTVGYLNYGA